jgi:hypothetical protein
MRIGGSRFHPRTLRTKRPPAPPRKKIPASRQNYCRASEQHSTAPRPSGFAGDRLRRSHRPATPPISRSPMPSVSPAPVGRYAMGVSPVKITISFSMSYPALATRPALRSHIIASSGQRHHHEVRSPKPSTTRDYMSRPAQASRSAWGFCASHPLRAFGGDGRSSCL